MWLSLMILWGTFLLTALAGNARSKTGVIPLYKPATPSSRITCRNTSRTPLGYVPSGAVCRRDFSTSGGSPTSQLHIPAMPPAKTARKGLMSVGSAPTGARAFFSHSYVIKYMPLAGTSRSRVAPVPRKMLRRPPSRYSLRTTSAGPEYWGLSPVWTWKIFWWSFWNMFRTTYRDSKSSLTKGRNFYSSLLDLCNYGRKPT